MFFLEFLAVGAIGFYVLIGVSAIIMSELLDQDCPGWATMLAVAVVAVLAVFGNFNPLVWIMANPAETGMIAVGYVVAGSVWGAVKWYFWLLKSRRKFDEIAKVDPTLSTLEVISRLSSDSVIRRGTSFPPQASDHKSRIIGWMALWPASIVWTMMNDPVRWVFTEVYNRIGGGLQAISNSVFKDVPPPNYVETNKNWR